MSDMMHTFETYDKDEAERFFLEKKPDIFQLYTYRHPITFKTVYVVKWFKM